MSEEVEIKISQPMFEVGELERLDNNIHSIVEEYSKMKLHEKDQILTQRIIIKQEEEIEKLQNQLQQKENIIKELEHDFESYDLEYLRETYQGSLADFIETELKRIQELKMGVNR